MENFLKETTALVGGRTYKTQISLRDIEKMQDYDRKQRVLADEHNLLCRKRKGRIWLAALVIMACFVVAVLVANSYFVTYEFWSTPVTKCSLLLPPIFITFALNFLLSMVSRSEMCYVTPFEFTEALELRAFLEDADLTQSLLISPGASSNIDAIHHETRLLEHFTFWELKHRYHDRDCVVIEGFATEPGDGTELGYCLRMVLPLELRNL